ncbi:MAG: pyridoxal 5'-phosphate synthase glutaminase subunit PdxT, partial [Acidobacteriota bacterium]|nr:pyridoxal 5'-phosphate synthase glutaminase subunit PdxT [Acidobacteriota bacterium]
MVVRRVGVLALQGDVREHVAMLARVGAEAVPVRTPADLEGVDALVLPGGESTTMARLLTTSGLRAPLADRLANSMAAFGTCAGLILLARQVLDGRHDQWSFGALDLVVTRNGYGRQIASFETTLQVSGLGAVPGVFIRAPRIESWASGVEVMAWHDHGDGERPVLVREGAVWGACFHPEL